MIDDGCCQEASTALLSHSLLEVIFVRMQGNDYLVQHVAVNVHCMRPVLTGCVALATNS